MSADGKNMLKNAGKGRLERGSIGGKGDPLFERGGSHRVEETCGGKMAGKRSHNRQMITGTWSGNAERRGISGRGGGSVRIKGSLEARKTAWQVTTSKGARSGWSEGVR